jgi:hypothetical protein
MEKCHCYVLPNDVSSSLPIEKKWHAQQQYQEKNGTHKRWVMLFASAGDITKVHLLWLAYAYTTTLKKRIPNLVGIF